MKVSLTGSLLWKALAATICIALMVLSFPYLEPKDIDPRVLMMHQNDVDNGLYGQHGGLYGDSKESMEMRAELVNSNNMYFVAAAFIVFAGGIIGLLVIAVGAGRKIMCVMGDKHA